MGEMLPRTTMVAPDGRSCVVMDRDVAAFRENGYRLPSEVAADSAPEAPAAVQDDETVDEIGDPMVEDEGDTVTGDGSGHTLPPIDSDDEAAEDDSDGSDPSTSVEGDEPDVDSDAPPKRRTRTRK